MRNYIMKRLGTKKSVYGILQDMEVAIRKIHQTLGRQNKNCLLTHKTS
jgi:hypothetical protein